MRNLSKNHSISGVPDFPHHRQHDGGEDVLRHGWMRGGGPELAGILMAWRDLEAPPDLNSGRAGEEQMVAIL